MGAFVAPTVRVGCSSHHLAFPGTLSVADETFHAIVVDLVSSLFGAGFRRIVLVPTHGGKSRMIVSRTDSAIVAVAPRADNLSLFKNLAGPGAFTQPVERTSGGLGQTEGAQGSHTPWLLIALALCVLAALAANEHWNGRLPVPRTSP